MEPIATVRPAHVETAEVRANVPRRRSIIREFALNTSTHGIPGIARGQSKHNRLFWTVSSLIFTGVMLYFIVTSIQEYLQYPTQTLVSIKEDWEQTFPAVTICNYSPIRSDSFMTPFAAYTNDTFAFSRAKAKDIRDFLVYRTNRNQSVREFYYSINESLISCNYNRMNCTADDFVSFQTSKHGLCHTFNGKTNRIRNGNVFSVTVNGEDGTLKLQLYAHSHLYVPHSFDGNAFLLSLDKPAKGCSVPLRRYWFFGGRSRQSRDAYVAEEYGSPRRRTQVPARI